MSDTIDCEGCGKTIDADNAYANDEDMVLCENCMMNACQKCGKMHDGDICPAQY